MTKSQLTIVMYHYVRELTHSRYPEIKGIDVGKFRHQLDFIEKNYTITSALDVSNVLESDSCLPSNACFLTFDDGYLDHYITVFPELVRRGIAAAFYPAAEAICRETLMEVNKIQLILAKNGYANADRLLNELRIQYEVLRRKRYPELISFDELRSMAGENYSRYDSSEVALIKSILQHLLPKSIRSLLIDKLYGAVMDVDERILAQEMYMSLDMLAVMAKMGMHIGSHGNKHLWLGKISCEEQEKEIDSSLNMLKDVYDSSLFVWSMCYPHGSYNDTLKTICQERGCAFALTTKAEIASCLPQNKFELSRIDTNDLPQ